LNKLTLPLLMYKEKGSVKKGTKKQLYVVPSWNHLYVIRNNRPILDKWALEHKEKYINETKKWIEENKWKKTENKKIIVNIWVYWNDARKKDCHNIDKLLMDSLNDLIYDDDANALVRFIDWNVDRENPRIELTFEVLGDAVRE